MTPRDLFRRSTLSAFLTGAAIGLLSVLVGFVALVAFVYLVMVGIGDCADPWAGCETALGVVG